MMIKQTKQWVTKVKKFEEEAHLILGKQESAKSRIVNLDTSYKTLKKLKLKQDDLFKQALTCTERECYRAAHVMAWASFMDFLEDKMTEDGCRKLNAVRPSWNITNAEDLRESVVEHQIIETTQLLGLCTKSQKKALLGLLNKRNECSHPTDYFPGLNETLGFISELLSRTATLQKKNL